MNITYFDLEGNNVSHQNCEYDRLEIYSKSGETKKTLGIYCGGTKPDVVSSESNVMRLEFSSDASVQKTGFNSTYITGEWSHFLTDI